MFVTIDLLIIFNQFLLLNKHVYICSSLFSASCITREVQPVATCRQSSARLAPTALAAPVLIMTSFSLWRHSLLSWPRPALQTYGHLTAF